MNVDRAEFKALTDQIAELAAQVAELARREVFNEAVIEVERRRAVEEDRASRPAARRRRGHPHPAGDGARLRLVVR